MKSSKYKTTLKCSGCVDKITPYMNNLLGQNNWKVDLSDPLKTLTVEVEADADKVIKTMAEAGYKAEELTY